MRQTWGTIEAGSPASAELSLGFNLETLGNNILDSVDAKGDDGDAEESVERAAALVRSLFCGLPNKERRMAVFVSFSDESETAGFFHHARLIAWEAEWDRLFVPAWQSYVLDRQPKIPYLHMTEIRSRAWREKYGLSQDSRIAGKCGR